jgi:hypothetical protein
MYFGMPKQPQKDETKNMEDGVAVQEYDPSSALPGTLPVGVTRIPVDTYDKLPDELKQQLGHVDFSDTTLNLSLKEAVEHVQNRVSRTVAEAALQQEPTITFDKIKKVSYDELLPEQRVTVNEALSKLGQFLKGEEENKPTTRDADGVFNFSSINELQKHIDSVWGQQQQSQTPASQQQSPFVQPPVVSVIPAENAVDPATVAKIPPTENSVGSVKRCPHCHNDLREVTPSITEAQKQEFLLSVVSASPYTETVTLFGGRVVLDMKTLNLDEDDLLTIAINRFEEDKTLPASLKVTISARATMVMCLEKIKTADRLVVLPDIALVNIDEACQSINRRFDAVKEVCSSPVVLAEILAECNAFYARYRYMSALASDENFWKPMSS